MQTQPSALIMTIGMPTKAAHGGVHSAGMFFEAMGERTRQQSHRKRRGSWTIINSGRKRRITILKSRLRIKSKMAAGRIEQFDLRS